jgi:uncharacterized protein (DUF2336 family)
MENFTGAQPSNLNIDQDDIRRMVTHPDRDVRASLTQKVCRQIRAAELTEKEQKTVSAILGYIVNDSASMVRRALAITLKKSKNLPREIAQKLIRDVDSIASPILVHSPVLTDEDLVDILKSKAASKIMAISKRERIKGDLVKAIIRFGDSKAVASLAANDGAEIGAQLGNQLLDMYHDNDLVKESFIARRDLPTSVVEKLITLVSAEVAVRLHQKHGVPVEMATELANQSRERASVDLLSQPWVLRDINVLVSRLEREGRLTNTLIVRAACCGQIQMVERAFARKSGVGLQKASLMVHDSGPFGLKALCTRSGLSDRDFGIVRAAIAIYRDMELKGSQLSRMKFQKTMLERVLSLPLAFSDEDMDYLFDKLDAVEAG